MAKRIVPASSVSIEEAVARFPTLRQSLLGLYDDCNLSAYFELEYARGWSTHPQARGTIFHRFAAECLRSMQKYKHETIPVMDARAILLDVCHQHNMEARDIVRVPMRMMPELRMAADKFAKDNTFSIAKIVDIERRMSAPISYLAADGSRVTRALTGQLDALLFDPPNGAIVLDWKDTWGLPPEPVEVEAQGYDDEELKGLSYHGYFQQRFYGWLVMRNYRNVDRVTLREFYVRKTKVRKATLYRHQMENVEEELIVLAEAFDRAIMQGSPRKVLAGDEEGYVNFDDLGFWKPSPGRHCGFCTRPTLCPIEEDTRVAAGGAATSTEGAARWAARLEIAERLKKMAIEACKGWVELGGAPIPVKYAKGRRVLGWYKTKRGRRFGFYTPDESERGGHAAFDEELKDAMRESTERARAERGVRPRGRAAAKKRRAGKA
jgi:PD-(D/E)XK nuclease superfamily